MWTKLCSCLVGGPRPQCPYPRQTWWHAMHDSGLLDVSFDDLGKCLLVLSAAPDGQPSPDLTDLAHICNILLNECHRLWNTPLRESPIIGTVHNPHAPRAARVDISLGTYSHLYDPIIYLKTIDEGNLPPLRTNTPNPSPPQSREAPPRSSRSTACRPPFQT